jgi:hypothetical protein
VPSGLNSLISLYSLRLTISSCKFFLTEDFFFGITLSSSSNSITLVLYWLPVFDESKLLLSSAGFNFSSSLRRLERSGDFLSSSSNSKSEPELEWGSDLEVSAITCLTIALSKSLSSSSSYSNSSSVPDPLSSSYSPEVSFSSYYY